VIDVILNNGETLEQVNVDNYNAFEMVGRSITVLNYFSAKQGLIRAQRANPNVQFRYIIGPKNSASFKMVPIVKLLFII
jgi:hypothetical protein